MAREPEFHPATAERWHDLVGLFGERGAYNGCWCMWFRKVNADWVGSGNAGNRRDLEALVDADRHPGILAYVGSRAVGWVSVAPRAEFTRISGQAATVIDEPPRDDVWSVVCFYIDREHRSQGIGRALLAEAVRFAGAHGARVVEAYPIELHEGRVPVSEAYTGVVSMYRDAGFREVGRFARWRAVPQVTDPVDPKPGPATGRPIHRRAIRRARQTSSEPHTAGSPAPPARARRRRHPPA